MDPAFTPDPRFTDPRPVWDRLADFWDRHLGEGNDFQKQLIMPVTDRLLDVKPGQTVLDACCGNGNYARSLAKRGANVVAFDGSGVFIERAKARTPADASIAYHIVDATDESAMLTLGQARFDSVVASMALMDLPTIDPLFRAVRRLLKPAGRFVFSIPHPCFSSNRPTFVADLSETASGIAQRFGIQIYDYLTPVAYLSTGIVNQPERHPLFHRPLHVLLAAGFNAGFVVDAIEEPAFPPASSSRSPFSWAKRPSLPPALIVRVRAGL